MFKKFLERLRRIAVRGLFPEIAEAKNKIEALESAMLSVETELRDLKRSMLFQRRLIMERVRNAGAPQDRVEKRGQLNCKQRAVYFQMLEKLAPDSYPQWSKLLEKAEQAYEGFPGDSCSVEGHPVAELFRGFVAPYLKGRVLDIGCGPQAVPVYLKGYPPNLISGVDPLSPIEPHDFEFVQGVAEFLPWEDGIFSVVIAATSLDHVLLLDRALSEIHRVLAEDGYFLVWEGFVKGAREYDPHQKGIEPIDEYHLYHFDKGWFERVVEEMFSIREVVNVDSGSHFYSLEPR